MITTDKISSAEDTESVVESTSAEYGKNQISPDDIKKFLIGLDYQRVNLSDYRERTYFSNIVSSLLLVKSERDQYYKILEQIKSFYFVQLLIDVLSDDCLNEDALTGAIIDVKVSDKNSNHEKYTEELRKLFLEFSIPTLVEDLMEELLLYGEYCLSMEAEKDKGITKLSDSIIPGTVIALYESNFPKVFYKLESNKYEAYPISHFAHFCIDSRKVKVKIPKELDKEAIITTPIFRIGRSVFYGGLEKIRELYMLEKAVSANTFFSLTTGNIVSINIPSTMPISDMMDITRKYESLLNSSKISAIDLSDVNQIVNVIKESFNVKVIPNFSDKGSLEKVDVISNSSVKDGLLPTINDARTSIAQTLGVPVELLFGEGGQSRRSALKQYVRYARKIKSIQRSIQNGLKQVCLNHLANKFNDSDIQTDHILVDMYTDTNIDEIDNLEGVQLIIQGINDLITLFNNVKSNDVLGLSETKFIDSDKFLGYLKSTLKSAGFKASDIVIVSEEAKNKLDNGNNVHE